MKITTHNRTGQVTFYPSTEPTPRAWHTIREVESIPTVLKGRRLVWIPADPEKPTGPGELGTELVPVPVPPSVSMHKFRGQLIKEGHLPEDVEAMLSQIPDTIARALALNEWRIAPTVQRAHPMVGQLATPLGYDTPEKVDAFFIRANDYTFGA